MATNSSWTVVFEDKLIIKQTGDAAETGYTIDDDSFWNDPKFSNIWAIQYGTSNTSDEVEHRDGTPHCSFANANIGDINQFSNKWDAAHLTRLQFNWDNNNLDGETDAEKINRLGARPTSYSS
jgi:hypothetical protein